MSDNTSAPHLEERLRSEITKQISGLFTNSMQYDPNLGRTFLPAGRVNEIKTELGHMVEMHLLQMHKDLKEDLTKLKVQELHPEKHYYITVPKDSDTRDIEDLIKITDQIAKDWPSFKAIRLVLSRGVDMDETKNGAIISSLMEMLKIELDKMLANGTAVQISAIDGAMGEGGAKTVAEIENKMAHQRGAFMHALTEVQKAFEKVGKKLTEQYYIVDKSDLKK